jgi:hypothetical protein
MSGERRLSREGDCKPSILPFRLSEMNFGLIAMVPLATLAIIVTLMFPEIQLQQLECPNLPIADTKDENIMAQVGRFVASKRPQNNEVSLGDGWRSRPSCDL